MKIISKRRQKNYQVGVIIIIYHIFGTIERFIHDFITFWKLSYYSIYFTISAAFHFIWWGALLISEMLGNRN